MGRGIVVALAVGALLSPATARGAGWLEPVAISSAGQDVDGADLAMGGAGHAIAVWDALDGSIDRVFFSAREPGGTFSAPVALSAPGGTAHSARVALDAAGNAVAVWVRHDGSSFIAQAAFRPVGGSFGPAVDLSEPGRSASDPQVASDGAGNVLAVWRRFDGAHQRVQYAERPAGGAFGAPATVSAAGADARTPRVTSNGSGGAVISWTRAGIAQAAVRDAGGPFAAPSDVSSPGTQALAPLPDLDTDGHAILSWSAFDPSITESLWSARPPGGTWSVPARLNEPGRQSGGARVLLDSAGTATAGWIERIDGSDVARSATRPRGGSFGAPASHSSPGRDADSLALALSPGGDAVLAWVHGEAFDAVVQATHRASGGAFVDARDISGAGNATEPLAVIDGTGSGLVAWKRRVGTNLLEGAFRTADAAPALTRLRVKPRRFRPARRGASVARARRGARVSYRLDRAATVAFRVQRRARGRRVDGKCVKPRPANRGAKPCGRWKRVRGRFNRESEAGANRFRFSGRVRGRKLRRGRHRLLATPKQGAEKGATVRRGFRIVR